jgi:hypothetical protein
VWLADRVSDRLTETDRDRVRAHVCAWVRVRGWVCVREREKD